MFIFIKWWNFRPNRKSFSVRLIVTMKLFPLHSENYISISFQIEWDMIVMTVFHSEGKLSLRLYLIQFERKWNTSFLSVYCTSFISYYEYTVIMYISFNFNVSWLYTNVIITFLSYQSQWFKWMSIFKIVQKKIYSKWNYLYTIVLLSIRKTRG